MFKVSVPMSIRTFNDQTLPIYIEYVKKCNVQRVFLCGMGEVYDERSPIYTQKEKIVKVIKALKACGVEAGIWVGTLGHGAALAGCDAWKNNGKYTMIEGIGGESAPHAICPSDENFLDDCAAAFSAIESLAPDIIMLDDDFRFDRAQHYFGCFCPKHLARFYEIVGEQIPREQIEEKVYTGGKNKYRDAYRQMIRETMMNFARRMRAAVDSVDPGIRLGLAGALENWDVDGLELPELIRAFAGETKPFFRTHGAPYWSTDIMKIIESTRMQNKWLVDAGIEDIMGEGDTYPRPRYNVPFKTLELFNYALIADEYSRGMLTYIFDYGRPPEYETGYIDKFVRCEPQRREVARIFEGKKAVGVTVFNAPHMIENWELPSKLIPRIAQKVHSAIQPASTVLLAKNSIPTSRNENGYPLFVMGESARSVEPKMLKNGAILDIVSAIILTKRGVDVGLGSWEKVNFESEYYPHADDVIPNISWCASYKIKCNDTARVLSTYLPDNTPSVYVYQNADGIRFMVMAYDSFLYGLPRYDLQNNYYKQELLIDNIEDMCGKKLPAKSKRNPNLYIYAAKDQGAMSVLLLNIHLDSIDEPVIELDGEYGEITFVNCEGRIEGNKVYLAEIQGYGMAAFEVKEKQK